MYAVISRLKFYQFMPTKESREFTCAVTEYPDVTVTVPTRHLPADEDFTFTLKVKELLLGSKEEHVNWQCILIVPNTTILK